MSYNIKEITMQNSVRPNKRGNTQALKAQADELWLNKSEQVQILLPEIARMRIKKKSWHQICLYLERKDIQVSEAQIRQYWCRFRAGRMPEEIIIDDHKIMLKKSEKMLRQQLEVEYYRKLHAAQWEIRGEYISEIRRLSEVVYYERFRTSRVNSDNVYLDARIKELEEHITPLRESNKKLCLVNDRLRSEVNSLAQEVVITRRFCKGKIGQHREDFEITGIKTTPLILRYGFAKAKDMVETLAAGYVASPNRQYENVSHELSMLKLKVTQLEYEIKKVNTGMQAAEQEASRLKDDNYVNMIRIEELIGDLVQADIDESRHRDDLEGAELVTNKLEASVINLRNELDETIRKSSDAIEATKLNQDRLIKRIKTNYRREREITIGWAKKAYRALQSKDATEINNALMSLPALIENSELQ